MSAIDCKITYDCREQLDLIFDRAYTHCYIKDVVCVIAALNLIIDFDFIERGAQNYLPKDFEWFGAFGLMVTLVWLYLEILRLLAKFQDRR